jgi:P-type Cu+ transporter
MSATSDRVELPITGMTCASCANRIERKLNKLEGVTATVNFATEMATVDFDPQLLEPHELVVAVESAGYGAALRTASPDTDPGIEEDETATLRRRLILSSALALPVLVLSTVPALQFDNWQWLALQLATPVVAWGAWPFHRAAWQNLKHATATMDTLISIGMLAAYGWSLYALFLGDAGMTGMKMGFDLVADPSEGTNHIYLEVASAVTVFMLAGRYFEACAKRRAGAAEGAVRAGLQGRLGARRRGPRAPRPGREPDRRRPLRGASRREARTASSRRVAPPST